MLLSRRVFACCTITFSSFFDIFFVCRHTPATRVRLYRGNELGGAFLRRVTESKKLRYGGSLVYEVNHGCMFSYHIRFDHRFQRITLVTRGEPRSTTSTSRPVDGRPCGGLEESRVRTRMRIKYSRNCCSILFVDAFLRCLDKFYRIICI